MHAGNAAVTPFEDPIPLPNGPQLVTLRDAADYVTKLPKAEHSVACAVARLLPSAGNQSISTMRNLQ